MYRRRTALLSLVLSTLFGCPAPGPPELGLGNLRLPPGFAIEIWAEVPGARSLAVAEEGAKVYVGTREKQIYAVLDPDRDGSADDVLKVADGLNVPNGVALDAEGRLYVVEQHRIVRFADADKIEVILPPGPLVDEWMHGWRYAAVGPDGMLYVAVGAPCNLCEPEGYAGTIIRMALEGGEPEVFARGIRNSVGFDWHPVTGVMFFTDNGVDEMGDTIPPDELNHAPASGLHFGFPYRYRSGEAYPGFEIALPSAAISHPVIEFEAHAAALGIRFYKGGMFPDDYRHDAFVAQHGSWNRTDAVGYRVMRIRFDANGMPTDREVFIDGWLGEDDEVTGRPVDLAELPDGSLLISDDYAGLIYRVTHL